MTQSPLIHSTLISVISAGCLCFSAMSQAMGTPPQKTARTVAESNANAVMLKADVLRATPNAESAELSRIEKGARVRLLVSQGGWSQITVINKTGWVRVLSVSSEARDAVDLSDLGALGKKPQGRVVAVAGTRGLDEENLKAASYSEAEIALLHGYLMGRTEAEQFAESAGLRARDMPYLATPGQ